MELSNRSVIFVTAYVLLLGFAFQGSRNLWQPDEGYNAAVTAEMIDSGDALVQRLDGQIYLGKPPMFIWCTVPFVLLLGRNEWGMRAFCALCFVLTVWITGRLGSDLWGRREGVLSALVFATLFLPFVASNVARPDAPLALATTASFFCFWRSLSPSRRSGLWKLALCAAIGWGFALKATAALIPALPMFVFLAMTGQIRSWFLTLWAIPGVLIFAVIGLSWYVYTAATIPGAGAYLWDSTVTGRLITTTYGRNPGFIDGLQIYIPGLLVGSFPWVFSWIPIGMRLKTDMKGRRWLAEIRSNEPVLFLLLWLTLPLCVYFLASSKLILYVLPVFPAIALLTARGLTTFMPTFSAEFPTRRTWIVLGSIGVLLLGFRRGLADWPIHKDEGVYWREIKKVLPPDCKRVIVINEDLDGLRFYSGIPQLWVTSGNPVDTDFCPQPRLEPALSKLEPNAGPCVVVFKTELKKTTRDLLESLLTKANLAIKPYPLPFDHTLLVCTPKGAMAVGASGLQTAVVLPLADHQEGHMRNDRRPDGQQEIRAGLDK